MAKNQEKIATCGTTSIQSGAPTSKVRCVGNLEKPDLPSCGQTVKIEKTDQPQESSQLETAHYACVNLNLVETPETRAAGRTKEEITNEPEYLFQ